MKTAIIYVFSGTGNTLLTANMLCRHLESQGISAMVYSVKAGSTPPPPDDYDYTGFGYPVYAYNMPEIFLKFALDLPRAPGKKAFIFKTSGEPFRLNSVSSCKLIKILKRKGYDVAVEQHMLMPYNILFRYPDSLAKQMCLYCGSLCAVLAKRLAAGERDAFKFNPLRVIISQLLRIQWPGARLNGRVYSVNKKKCTHCMRCLRDCPVGNISYKDGKFRFGWRCNMCMRCAMLCPADAINTGFIPFFKINGAYDFKRLLADPDISAEYINADTKGYFRLFRKFFRDVDITLDKYGIRLPVSAAQNKDVYFTGSGISF